MVYCNKRHEKVHPNQIEVNQKQEQFVNLMSALFYFGLDFSLKHALRR